jgi:hypothetical protein
MHENFEPAPNLTIVIDVPWCASKQPKYEKKAHEGVERYLCITRKQYQYIESLVYFTWDMIHANTCGNKHASIDACI